jgi:hypothetical protein
MATSGPGPAPPLFEPTTAWLTFGLAAACGTLGACFPDRFWRRSRWDVIHPNTHND